MPYGCEIADGAGLLFSNNYINEINLEVNLIIENSTFSSNRGHSGAGVFIKTVNSLSIMLVNTTFRNNSVLNFRINSSAFLLSANNQKMLPFVPLLHLFMCKFYNNYEGRNMIGYTIEGASPVKLLIENCTYVDNSKYDITMMELNMHSTNTSAIVKDTEFINNSGSAIIYFQIHTKNIVTTLYNIKIMNNYGFATEKEGGLILVEVSGDNCILNVTGLTFNENYYASIGGGIYVTGSFQSSYQCYIKDSCFGNNSGIGSGTVVYSSLSCATEKTYVMFINSCRFIHNEGNSIVYIAMEYYVLPVFVVLADIEFNNNSRWYPIASVECRASWKWQYYF